jgi:hypothetical protein
MSSTKHALPPATPTDLEAQTAADRRSKEEMDRICQLDSFVALLQRSYPLQDGSGNEPPSAREVGIDQSAGRLPPLRHEQRARPSGVGCRSFYDDHRTQFEH